MAIDEHLTEHARGAMIGLAIGDALGMPTQSMSAERIIECYGGPVRRLMDAVPQQPIAPNMKAGSVTDDTEQAFVLAARLIEDHGRIDNDAYAQDLLRWEAKMKEKGSLDLLGPSTKAALQALAEGVDPELTGRFGTTNGGAMRATPVGIAFIPGNALAEEAWRSCVVTHNTMQGIESTTLVAAAVSLAIAGERGFLSKALAFVESQPPRGNWSAKASVVARVKMFMEWAVREDGSMSDGEFATILRRDCGTSVEANESVAAAFAIATRFFDKPTEALCFAASLGGDTDTIAAITGAWHGPDGFDPDMRGQVLRQLKDDDRLDLDRTVAGLCALREREACDRHGPRTRRRNRLRGLRIPQVEPAHRDPGRRVDRPIQWPVRVGRHRPGWSTLQGVVFTVCCVISGAVFGGALMWFVQKALAKTGVLDRFESGKADVVA